MDVNGTGSKDYAQWPPDAQLCGVEQPCARPARSLMEVAG